MKKTKHLVAVDIGSNSFHLVIAQEQSGFIKIIQSQKQRVFLNKGINEQNELNPDAIERGIQCLAHFNNAICELEHYSIRIVATHALRKAANSDLFIKSAFDVLPHPIEIISGDSEAKLIFQGVSHTQPIKGKALVIDIGGGSTEIIIGQAFKAKVVHSLELGSSEITKRFFNDGLINENQVQLAQQFACDLLRPVADHYRQFGWRSAMGTSGSIKAITLSVQELYQVDQISYKLLKQLKQQLIDWGHIDEFNLTSIDKQRRPLLMAAVCILCACFDMLVIRKLSFSTGALREGVLYGLSNSRPNIDIKQRTINQLCELYFIDTAASLRVAKQLHGFAKLLARHQQVAIKEHWQLLYQAAKLYQIGVSINAKKHQYHGQYILAHCDMPGFESYQQQLLANIVGNFKGKISPFTGIGTCLPNDVLQLIQLFRLAVILSKGEPSTSELISGIHYRQNNIQLCINSNLIQQPELIRSLENEMSQLAKVGLKMQISTS